MFSWRRGVLSYQWEGLIITPRDEELLSRVPATTKAYWRSIIVNHGMTPHEWQDWQRRHGNRHKKTARRKKGWCKRGHSHQRRADYLLYNISAQHIYNNIAHYNLKTNNTHKASEDKNSS